MTEIMKCPVCGQALISDNRIWRCTNRHSYDVAKEGYVNLLSAHRSGDKIGDNREMALSRRDFLNKGYYALLAEAVTECLSRYSSDVDTVLISAAARGTTPPMLRNNSTAASTALT